MLDILGQSWHRFRALFPAGEPDLNLLWAHRGPAGRRPAGTDRRHGCHSCPPLHLCHGRDARHRPAYGHVCYRHLRGRLHVHPLSDSRRAHPCPPPLGRVCHGPAGSGGQGPGLDPLRGPDRRALLGGRHGDPVGTRRQVRPDLFHTGIFCRRALRAHQRRRPRRRIPDERLHQPLSGASPCHRGRGCDLRCAPIRFRISHTHERH